METVETSLDLPLHHCLIFYIVRLDIIMLYYRLIKYLVISKFCNHCVYKTLMSMLYLQLNLMKAIQPKHCVTVESPSLQ